MSTDADLARLATLVAHEMRTPLSVVSGYMKMLAGERQGPLTEAQRRSVEGATRASQQLTTLAADLSLLARIVRGEVSANRSPVALQPLLADLAAGHTPHDEHPVQVEAVSAADPAALTVSVDAANLRRALAVLLAAAVRSAPDEATLRITARRRTDGGATATATSTIIAIAPADAIEALLEADPETLATPDESTGGLGVGLPLARWLVGLDGGTMRAQKTPHGLGILVLLPA
jgi:signal transduction histidine kinase